MPSYDYTCAPSHLRQLRCLDRSFELSRIRSRIDDRVGAESPSIVARPKQRAGPGELHLDDRRDRADRSATRGPRRLVAHRAPHLLHGLRVVSTWHDSAGSVCVVVRHRDVSARIWERVMNVNFTSMKCGRTVCPHARTVCVAITSPLRRVYETCLLRLFQASVRASDRV